MMNIRRWIGIILSVTIFLSGSTIVYAESEQKKITFNAIADATVVAGWYSLTNYGTDETLMIKHVNGTDSTDRKAYIKFDISGITDWNFGNGGINIKVQIIDAENNTSTATTYVYGTDTTWKEEKINFINAPATKELVGVYDVAVGRTLTVDVTEYVKSKHDDGATEVSFALCQEEGRIFNTVAASRENAEGGPILECFYWSEYPNVDGFGKNVDPEEWAKEMVARSNAVTYQDVKDIYENELVTEWEEKHSEEWSDTASVYRNGWETLPTRTVSTLTDFEATEDIEVCHEYGGMMSRTGTNTGFYHTELIDGRWWIVDPHGHLTIIKGVDSVNWHSLDSFVDTVYGGSYERWQKEGIPELKRLGFYSGNAWVDLQEYGLNGEEKLPQTLTLGCLVNYAADMGRAEEQEGHLGFIDNNCPPVFDPDWEDYVDRFLKGKAALIKDNPDIIGIYSDNELPHDSDMLKRYLTLDPMNPYAVYSYATAWEWFRQRTGKERPTLLDITDEITDDFYDFIYDRYYQVVQGTFRKYDNQHMYLGFRMMDYNNTIYRRGIIRATGRYADVMSINLYGHWTPEKNLLHKFYVWSGKPMMVTEWYSRAVSGGGAGWIVETEQDKAKFYENFALQLLETKTCIGWNYFTYTHKYSGVIDPDTGKITESFEPSVTAINNNAYNIIDFFDNRNSVSKLVSTDDTYVTSGSIWKINHGTEELLMSKRASEQGIVDADRRTYIKFDISDYTANIGEEFLNAEISLTNVGTAQSGAQMYVTEWADWDEMTFTAETEPFYKAYPLSYDFYEKNSSVYTYIGEIAAAANATINVNLTNYVKSLISKGTKEFTVVIIGEGKNTDLTARQNMQLASKETTLGEFAKPTLTIKTGIKQDTPLSGFIRNEISDGRWNFAYKNLGSEEYNFISIIASYDTNGSLITVKTAEEDVPMGTIHSMSYIIDENNNTKVFLWDGMKTMRNIDECKEYRPESK